MSKTTTKSILIEARELGFKSAQLIEDLSRFLAENLPQLKITLDGNDIDIVMPASLSKRAIKLRIKKFLYRKGINNDFRAISITNPSKKGYIVKEKKNIELSYY